jgi:hypothetical protein
MNTPLLMPHYTITVIYQDRMPLNDRLSMPGNCQKILNLRQER